MLDMVELLEGLGLDVVDRFYEQWTEKTYYPDGTILNQGGRGTHMVWIRDGTAEVLMSGSFVAQVTAGDLVGEISFAMGEHGRYTATVRAKTKVDAAVIDQAGMRRLVVEVPEFGPRFYQQLVGILSERVTATSEALSQMNGLLGSTSAELSETNSQLALARRLVQSAKAEGFLQPRPFPRRG